MPDFPDINIEIISDYALADTVADRYDAGVRLGEHVDKDMISVRIGPDFRLVVVGAPSYFENHARTTSPQELTEYSCIGLRLPTHDGFYAWPYGKDGRELNKRVRGRAAFNSMDMMMEAALSGFGLAMVPDDVAREDVEAGRLVQVLTDWTPRRAGYHLYYPSRRQHAPAFALVLEALRYRG